MLSLTDNARMIWPAALPSPNASAAVLLDPITSANIPVSRTSRVRALDRSQASTAVMAMTSEIALVSTPRNVSFRASDRLECQETARCSQRLGPVMAVVLEDLGELQQSGAQTDAGALRGVGIDGEPHAAVLDEEADDAADADEFVARADGEDRRALELVENRRRPCGVDLADVEQVTGAQSRAVGAA